MNKLLTALAAVSTLAIAAPAAGQYSNQWNPNANANAYGSANFANRIARLDARLRAGVDAGDITGSEARTLRQELRGIARLERQYSRNGLSQWERQELQRRLRDFRQDLALADGRGGDRYGGNEDVYDDPYSGQGGPYEEAGCDRGSGGIGGIIGSVFGGNNDDCDGLRVGQRASGNLSTLPSYYRSQFRDGNGIVYRTDGRQIYQIDTRSNTVLRVYAMTR